MAAAALIVSILAVLVAAGPWVIAAKTYRRGGPWIVVDAQKAIRISGAKSGRRSHSSVIQVTIVNRGLATATIKRVDWQSKSSRWRPFPAQLTQIDAIAGSPALPTQIEPYTAETLLFSAGALKRAVDELPIYVREQTRVSEVPELLAAWADETHPSTVMVAGSMTLRRFRCPAGHHPRITPLSFFRSGCPSCRGNATRTQRLEAVAADPETHTMNREIASQFHPTLNGKARLQTISPESKRALWWIDAECGHVWQASPREREKGQRPRCPGCRSILDSLAYYFPEIGAEWSGSNPLTAWQVRPSGQTTFVPDWVCSTNPAHVWQAPLASRTAGAGCPECREAGKSKVELDHHAAAETVFGSAASGRPVTSEAFKRRAHWLVDIVIDLADGQKVAIEYDGAYWHADKAEIDTAKSLDLLAADYWVARLREHPLPPLAVTDPCYREFVVHATAPDAHSVIAKVRDWIYDRR